MALIHEEKTHQFSGVELMTSEREDHETRGAWQFIDLSFNHKVTLTPKELRDLGHWLVKEGKRIGREYNSNGAPKATKEQRS